MCAAGEAISALALTGLSSTRTDAASTGGLVLLPVRPGHDLVRTLP